MALPSFCHTEFLGKDLYGVYVYVHGVLWPLEVIL